MQCSTLRDKSNRAAAGADLDDVDHRDLDRKRFLIATDKGRACGQHVALGNDTRFCRSAAHIESNGIRNFGVATDGLRRDHAGGRARFQYAHALLSRLLEPKQSAGRLRYEKCAGKSGRSQMAVNPGEISRNTRPDIGIRRHGRGSFELAIFLRQLMRYGDEGARQQLLQNALGAQLMGGIAVTVQKQHGDRFDLFLPQLFGDAGDFCFVQRRQHFTIRQNALIHLEPVDARNQRLVLPEIEIV